MSTNTVAVSRRSSNDRPEQIVKRLRMVSSGMTRHGALVELRKTHPLHGVAIDFALIE
jgi:hypothetical protein